MQNAECKMQNAKCKMQNAKRNKKFNSTTVGEDLWSPANIWKNSIPQSSGEQSSAPTGECGKYIEIK